MLIIAKSVLVLMFEVDSYFTFSLAEFIIIIMLFGYVKNALLNDHMGIMTKMLGHPRLRFIYLLIFTPFAIIYDIGIIMAFIRYHLPRITSKKS